MKKEAKIYHTSRKNINVLCKRLSLFLCERKKICEDKENIKCCFLLLKALFYSPLESFRKCLVEKLERGEMLSCNFSAFPFVSCENTSRKINVSNKLKIALLVVRWLRSWARCSISDRETVKDLYRSTDNRRR